MILPERCGVAIVGAGIAGLALARELRRRGLTPLVLDRSRQPPAESTARAAWMIRTDGDDEAVAALARRGGELWRTGAFGTFRPTGGFLIGRGERDDLAAFIPAARGRGEWRKDDGIVDSTSAIAALASPPQFTAYGAAVLRIEPERDGVAIVTAAGTVRADVAVNAAGAWAGVVGSLPLAPLKRHVAITDCRRVPAGAPFAWDVVQHAYFRPYDGGLLLCICDERASEPGDARVEPGAVEEIVATFERLQPGLSPQRVTDAWAGQRTFAPDRRFVVGWDPRVRGLFHLAALGGHGVTVAPALAEACAPAVEAGPDAALPEALRPFSPARLLAP